MPQMEPSNNNKGQQLVAGFKRRDSNHMYMNDIGTLKYIQGQ